MYIEEKQVFNLMDTNGRRSDVLNAFNIYLQTLQEIKDDYPSFPVDVESVKKEYRNAFLNELREDVNKESFATEKILQNATNSNDCFVVPKVVE